MSRDHPPTSRTGLSLVDHEVLWRVGDIEPIERLLLALLFDVCHFSSAARRGEGDDSLPDTRSRLVRLAHMVGRPPPLKKSLSGDFSLETNPLTEPQRFSSKSGESLPVPPSLTVSDKDPPSPCPSPRPGPEAPRPNPFFAMDGEGEFPNSACI